MGGHGHGKYPPLLIDPAIEKWSHMRDNTEHFFRFTPRTVRYSLLFAVAIPLTIGYIYAKDADRYSFLGARQGDQVRREKPWDRHII